MINQRDKAMVPDDEPPRSESIQMASVEEQGVLMSRIGHYDETGSNPQRNLVAEVTRTESRTLSFSKIHKFGTWNQLAILLQALMDT